MWLIDSDDHPYSLKSNFHSPCYEFEALFDEIVMFEDNYFLQ